MVIATFRRVFLMVSSIPGLSRPTIEGVCSLVEIGLESWPMSAYPFFCVEARSSYRIVSTRARVIRLTDL